MRLDDPHMVTDLIFSLEALHLQNGVRVQGVVRASRNGRQKLEILSQEGVTGARERLERDFVASNWLTIEEHAILLENPLASLVQVCIL